MKTIVELTREAGGFDATPEFLERLVALARADEREACAEAVRFADNGTEAAEIIRARGNT